MRSSHHLALLLALATGSLRASEPDFQADVAPILVKHCLGCHQGSDPSGGLDLSSAEALTDGGASGHVIDDRSPKTSLMWEKLTSGEMPPEDPIRESDKAVLLRWLQAGATWRGDALDAFAVSTDRRAGYDFWSLQPIEDPDTPRLGHANPIDDFVQERLNEQGLDPAPRADPRILVRRLSFKLHGLQPDPQWVDRLVAQPDEETFAQLIDELLASPRYGERWARHWLDLARFGESQGFERDKSRAHAWRYRDWVIDALNRDMPYDQFVKWQIAGDCLPEAGREGVIATGFLVACGWDEVGQNQLSKVRKALVRQDELEDYIGTVGQTFLALTTNCARCHDHKFDPIRQSEYYALASALDGVRPGDRDISLDDADNADDKQWAYAVVAKQPSQPTQMLLRGNPATPAETVTPGALRAIPSLASDFGLAPDAPQDERRRRLADWIANENNPLFARTIVNRLWQHHFGKGIVETPNDFGFSGGRPSHPKLLDFLASRLIESGWRLKPIHRLIVTSQTWQRAVVADALAEQTDSENRYLWRGNRTRLDAESLRDSILVVAGRLNEQRGGPGFEDFRTFHFNSQFYEMLDPVGAEFNRRTIYRKVIRSGRNRLLDAFDCPDPSATAPKRATTTTPLQALSLLNHSFVLRMSDHFAERVIDNVGEDAELQVEHAIQLAWCRMPNDLERDECAQFVRQHGLPAFCRVLLNSNEFLYVD